MRTLQDIQNLFPDSQESGLSSDARKQSLDQFGNNALTPLPREPLWKKFIGMFDDPIIKILLAAALLSMFVDLFQQKQFQLAGIVLVIVVGVTTIAAVIGQGKWIPTLMFASAIVTFFIGLLAPNVHPSIEGLAVMIAVILATGVAFLSEYQSDREFEILNAQKESIQTKVIRDGDLHTVSLEEVIVGDVVDLETGDEIPADGRVIKATDLYVDQSLMTGESEPVRKLARLEDDADGPEQPGCVYRGTQIVDGKGLMRVCEVGDTTYLGQIARRLSAEDGDEDEVETADSEETRVKDKLSISKALTPLQEKLTRLAELISMVGYIASGAIFVALVVRGLITGDLFWPDTTEDLLTVSNHLLSYFIYMVIIIVVAVPEGLPMSVTVSLALAMRKMTRANSLVRQLVACETIGSATVICSDKTGTLTQNKMSVVRLFYDGKTMDRGQSEWTLPDKEGDWPRDGQPLDYIALNSMVNSTANLEDKEGQTITVGNSTEGALLHWTADAGLEYRQLRKKFEPLYLINFSSERKHMTTVIRYGDRLVTLAKGAPEWVLENSTHYQTADGQSLPWTPEAKEAVENAIRDSASQAMRTLAFAHVELPGDFPDSEDGLHEKKDQLENNLVFTGFVAIRDPLRDDVQDAIKQCRDAGIEVKMITGDNVETARAIAFDIGLIESRDAAIDSDEGVIFTSAKFNELHSELVELKKKENPSSEEASQRDQLEERIANLRVLARARPLDKYKMVELLQDRNEVVAVTGDGTNDAPALKKADVGLAMGIAGTEVAKEASKIVLLDDAFSTIVNAVHWGRSLYENIQRFLQFQLTINVSALIIAFLGPFFGIAPPFTVLQLLWINVIMDTFAAIALCSEPPRPGVMKQPPKKRDEDILTPAMKGTILSTAGFFVVVMMTLLAGMYYLDWFQDLTSQHWSMPFSEKKGDTRVGLTIFQVSLFFSIYVFFQVWNQINCRSLTPEETGFKGLFANRTFLTIVGIIVVVQIVITSVPGIAAIFFKENVSRVGQIDTLDPLTWLMVIGGTASVLIFDVVNRWYRSRRLATT